MAYGIFKCGSMVKHDITNQMTNAVESRAAIIDDYVASAEEYLTAFALGSEVHALLKDPEDPELLSIAQKYTEDFHPKQNFCCLFLPPSSFLPHP